MATIDQRIYDGDRAREVLTNEAFEAAFNDIRQELTEQWMQSPVRDQEGREKLYQLLRLTDKLKSALTTRLQTGEMAKMDLAHEESLLKRAARSVGIA